MAAPSRLLPLSALQRMDRCVHALSSKLYRSVVGVDSESIRNGNRAWAIIAVFSRKLVLNVPFLKHYPILK